jgi:iron complex outermembrane receptor protein
MRNAVNHAFGTLEWRASPRWLFNAGAMIEDNSLTGAPWRRASANYHMTDSQTWRCPSTAPTATRSPSNRSPA